MKNTRKNNASKKIKWNGHTYTSVKVFGEKMSKLFNENIYPHKVRYMLKNNLNYHGSKIIVVKNKTVKKVAVKAKEPLVWNNSWFNDYKDMADILDIKKSVIKACLREDIPLMGYHIDFMI